MMTLQQEARRAMPGLRDLFLGRAHGLTAFPVSAAGFWRAFLGGFGLLCLLEALWAALGASPGTTAAMAAAEALALALAVVGGAAFAGQMVVGLADLEEWDRPVLRILVPFVWLGVATWAAGLGLRVAGAALDLDPGTIGWLRAAVAAAAAFTAWQAVRIGLHLRPGAAGAVVMTAAMACFGGFIVVGMAAMVV